MRPLKKRLRPDNIPSEQRVVRGNAGRMLYIALLSVFGFFIGNYMFGDYVLFSADGLVLRDQHVIATTYIARVEAVHVKEGQPVKTGAPLIKLSSSEILERLADLSTKRAGLMTNIVDFKVRAENVARLLPLAQRRAAEAKKTIEDFDNLANERLVTSARHQEALTTSYEANREQVNLATQGQVLNEEMTALNSALDDADDAITRLKQLYADGSITAPADGSIGATVPAVGNVYRPGEPMLSVYSGEAYVLAFLPRRYLFPIRKGMSVTVSDGRDSTTGVITEILAVTDTLPKEFQNTFKPSDRNQLAKIKIESPSPLPLHQKVEVSHIPLLGAL